MRLPRMGIRLKLLGFYGVMIVLVVAFELFAQAASSRAGLEYEERLSRYHAVHRLRVALAECRAVGDLYIRELRAEQLERLHESLPSLHLMVEALESCSSESLWAFFEVQASRRGIEAYVPMLSSALNRRASGDPDFYAEFAKADRIAGYTESYLSKLLSILMAAGESRYRELSGNVAVARRVALAGILGTGALSLLFAAIFAESVSKPIRALAAAADRIAGGELEVESVAAETKDEIEVLARGFNAMAQNIRGLVEGLREKAELEKLLHDEELALVSMGRALREAQFMNLQDQMRPHFLFNALNTIARTALIEGASGTERLSRGLARLMRYALQGTGAFVRLDEELEIVREYLSFQSIRFGARLVWRIEAAEGVGAARVPRFTLQPIVENAVRHGIEPLEAGGTVTLALRRRGGRLRMQVADRGAGMDAATLERIRAAISGSASPSPAEPPSPDEALAGGDGGTGLGFANLRERLAYRYGDEARVCISSVRGRGTVVRVSIPFEEGPRA